MKHWNVVVFGKLSGEGFLSGKAFAVNARRAVELCGEPTAIAFPCLQYGDVQNKPESFEWTAKPTLPKESQSWPKLRIVSD